MNKRFNISNNSVLSGIIDHIEATSECPKFKKYSSLIDIDTWENIKYKMPNNKGIAEKGFGFCISSYYEFGKFTPIIVINTNNCSQVDFTEREIAAIIYHELGHLLNKPELAKVPTIMDYFLNGAEYSEDMAEGIRMNNAIKMEVFADSYASQHGYGDELISTFYKQNLHFEQKIGYLETRTERIKNKEHFQGTVAPIDINGW